VDLHGYLLNGLDVQMCLLPGRLIFANPQMPLKAAFAHAPFVASDNLIMDTMTCEFYYSIV
jgi:hypothetical protein